MRSSLNFNHLECFFSLAKTLSFSKTSKDLMIAQPAVSKQIKLLEESLQMQLFIRTRQSVKLSSNGKNLYDKTWPLFSEICNRVKEISSKVDDIEGSIVFGCLREVGEKIFIHVLNEFKRANTKIRFQVKYLKGAEIVEGVKEGKIDIGIVSEKIIQENIRSYKILEEEIILVTNKLNSKLKIDKVTSLPFVSFRDNDPLLDYYLRKVYPKAKLNKLNIEFSINSHKSMIDVIKNQGLYAVLPTLSIKKELEQKELVAVGPKSLKSKLYLIHSDLEYVDKKIICFRDFLRDYSKKNF